MTILQFDSMGGASGDMILAALLDLGADFGELKRQLAGFSIGPFSIEAGTVSEHGLHGTQVHVRVGEHDHAHRNLAIIEDMIQKSALPEQVKQMSCRVFERLADAEASVHGTTPDKVHFHEVGAVDSIVDIVGACVCLGLLGADQVAVGPLPAGYGSVESAHGTLPLPAPATVELLKGCPIVQTDEPFELVTPTGAALLTTWKTMETPPGGSRLVKSGHGFGHRKLNHRPNLLRAFLLESAPAASDDACLVLECNIDDMAPEITGSLIPKLLGAEALDVFLTPIQMKKQRPGILLTVLCRPSDKERLLDIIFTESTTFGVREHLTPRTIIERRHVEVQTPYGPVRVKVGRWKGKDVTHAPEYEDCLKAAETSKVPVRAVYEAAMHAVR